MFACLRTLSYFSVFMFLPWYLFSMVFLHYVGLVVVYGLSWLLVSLGLL